MKANLSLEELYKLKQARIVAAKKSLIKCGDLKTAIEFHAKEARIHLEILAGLGELL